MRTETYPIWRYHSCQSPRIVYSKEQDHALGPDWHDSPADIAPGPQSDEAADENVAAVESKAPEVLAQSDKSAPAPKSERRVKQRSYKA